MRYFQLLLSLAEERHVEERRNSGSVCKNSRGAGASCICFPGRPLHSGMALAWISRFRLARNRLVQELPSLQRAGDVHLRTSGRAYLTGISCSLTIEEPIAPPETDRRSRGSTHCDAGTTAQLVANASLMALWRRGKPNALLHHSDRGSQGGFNRSSQHSSKRGCDEEIQAAFGSVCANSFEIARPPPRGTAREL